MEKEERKNKEFDNIGIIGSGKTYLDGIYTTHHRGVEIIVIDSSEIGIGKLSKKLSSIKNPILIAKSADDIDKAKSIIDREMGSSNPFGRESTVIHARPELKDLPQMSLKDLNEDSKKKFYHHFQNKRKRDKYGFKK